MPEVLPDNKHWNHHKESAKEDFISIEDNQNMP
jgi:hypothetical protein